MGIFDSLKNIAESTIRREATKAVTNAVNSIGKGKNRSEKFVFNTILHHSKQHYTILHNPYAYTQTNIRQQSRHCRWLREKTFR